MKELVYADGDVYQEIKKRWPNATFEDASDFIAIRYGFATCCFRFQILLQGAKKEDLDKIGKWIEQADKLKNAK